MFASRQSACGCTSHLICNPSCLSVLRVVWLLATPACLVAPAGALCSLSSLTRLRELRLGDVDGNNVSPSVCHFLGRHLQVLWCCECGGR
jgi:hypothetical protein